MIQWLDLQDTEQAQHLLAIQHASYAVEAELIGFWDIPPLHDTLASLQACGETFYGYFVDDQLAGAISFKVDGTTLDIHRLIVDPPYFRRGIASALLLHLDTLALPIEKMVVSTGTKNSPARRLYAQHGFQEIGEQEVAPNVSITLLTRGKNPAS